MRTSPAVVGTGRPLHLRLHPGALRQSLSRLTIHAGLLARVVTPVALFALTGLWASQLYFTWATWGNLTADSGHEMYVPAMLAEGQLLYRDVWFMYGPASPYFNSLLFRLFGTHLNVLYWAGSLAALGSAILLYFIGRRLSARLIGWTAGAVLLLEAFDSSLFSFPLPYSFAAVYGCVVGCVFVWVAVNAVQSAGQQWIVAASALASLALLVKPEFGLASGATLGLLILVRGVQHRSPLLVWRDIIATLPGILLCAAVIYWMVSIAGVSFITQENIVSWPTSYFMKQFGTMWLEQNGFVLTAPAFREAAIRALFPVAVLLGLYGIRHWRARGAVAVAVGIGAFLSYYIARQGLSATEIVSALVFPSDMVLYVSLAAAIGWLWFWWRPTAYRDVASLVVLTFGALVAFRILLKMQPSGYAIFYNGPVILGYLLLARVLCRQLLGGGRPWSRFASLLEITLCVLCFGWVAVVEGQFGTTNTRVPLITPRGTIRVAAPKAQAYEAAIKFMREKAAVGESVLSVPEDTSLYFLSESYSPTRVYLFTPGVVAPGKMTDEVIQQIEQKRVRYLLWSNRKFPEFGVPVFGTDYNREIGDYLHSHYRRIGPLAPANGWRVDVWERRADTPFR